MERRFRLSSLRSVKLREWQDKETLDEIGNQVWDDMTEEWTEYVYGEDNSPVFVNVDILDLPRNRRDWRE